MNLRRALKGLLERWREVEVIGQEACPMMLRWTIADLKFLKLLVHYFPPEVSDRDPHDHPRSFLTFVLRGNYRDVSWKEHSFEERQQSPEHMKPLKEPVTERVCAGAVRFRSAKHLHIVETDEQGCWTVVIMGPLVREWGFVRLGSELWWPWGKYIQRFGGVIRCDAPPDKMGQITDEDIILWVYRARNPVSAYELASRLGLDEEALGDRLDRLVTAGSLGRRDNEALGPLYTFTGKRDYREYKGSHPSA